MKTNLSSQIKLDTIPRRYYAPEGDIERASLTREEKIYTRIFESASEAARKIPGTTQSKICMVCRG